MRKRTTPPARRHVRCGAAAGGDDRAHARINYDIDSARRGRGRRSGIFARVGRPEKLERAAATLQLE